MPEAVIYAVLTFLIGAQSLTSETNGIQYPKLDTIAVHFALLNTPKNLGSSRIANPTQ